MNKKLAVVVGSALAVASVNANAFDVKLSGHVYRAVMWADDGGTSETYHVDPNTAPSRFRFTAADDLMPGIKAGVLWETGFNSNFAASVNQNSKSQNGGANNGLLNERIQEVWFSGAFGRLGLGQGDGAAKDAVGVDFSGTGLINGPAAADIGGGLLYRTSTGALSAISVASRLSNLDAEGRYDRLRFDSPALGPVVLSASTGYNNAGNDIVEFKAVLTTALGGGGKLGAAVGRSKEKQGGTTGDEETTGASVSLLLPLGLNFTVAGAQKENEAATPLDAQHMLFKVGYSAGKHSVSFDVSKGDDQVAPGDEAKQMGIGYVFKPTPWADIVAGVKVFSFDDAGATEYDDITVITVGSRLVF